MSNVETDTKIENSERFVLFPIKYNEIWKAYKNSVANFWVAEEVDLTLDNYEALKDSEKHFISHTLAFFAASDGIVGENLAMRFYNDVKIPEARAFYGFQLMMEGIHSEMYSLLIDTYIKNTEEKNKLFNAINEIPIIHEKAKWALKWIDSTDSFAERLVAFAIVEGIFFSSSFCSIYWLKKRGLMPGLSFSNESISKDENLHCEFACLLYKTLEFNLPQKKINELIMSAVDLELKFSTEALSVNLIGMNSDMMCQYIKFIADGLAEALGYNKIYNENNPFDFMEMISLQGKGNFFEKKISQYQKFGVGQSEDNNKIKFDANF